MERKLGKKARINFSPMEKEYNARFGMFPDYHYDELHKKHDAETARITVQKNMDEIWADMKERQRPAFRTADANPFCQ